MKHYSLLFLAILFLLAIATPSVAQTVEGSRLNILNSASGNSHIPWPLDNNVYLSGNNFIFRNAADNWRLYINGSNGRVGIGTTDPLAGLDVRANAGSIMGNGLFFYGSGFHSDGLPFARLVENHGIRYSSPDSRWVFSSGPSVLIGYNPNGHNLRDWGQGHLMVEGNVGIGFLDQPAESKLAVNGNAKIVGSLKAKEVKVTVTGLPDYVFASTYRLRPLGEVHQYVKQHGHLPEVPSAEEVAREGLNLGEMDKILLKKVEELTLYLIEIKQENEALKRKLEELAARGR